jgi:hypothetical protein
MAGSVSAIVDIPSKTFREYARRVLVTAAYNMRLKFPVPVRRIAPRLPRPTHRRRQTMRIAR